MTFVGRSIWLTCLVALGGLAQSGPPAAAQSSLLGEVAVTGQFQLCNNPGGPFEAVRPTVRYQAQGIALGGIAVPATANAGDRVDFFPNNSPDFNNFATLLTNGVNDVLGWRLEFLDANGLAGYIFRDRPETEILADAVAPDLVGARLAFARFIIDSIDAGVIPCEGGTGTFATVEGRWQFWGTQRLELAVESRGCDPCSAEQIADFVAVVVNPGELLFAELRLTATAPHGAPIDLLPGSVQRLVPPGVSELPLVSLPVPGQVPAGAYLVEAALLDPARGITLARNSIRVVKQ
jgi:hypothetical protein